MPATSSSPSYRPLQRLRRRRPRSVQKPRKLLPRAVLAALRPTRRRRQIVVSQAAAIWNADAAAREEAYQECRRAIEELGNELEQYKEESRQREARLKRELIEREERIAEMLRRTAEKQEIFKKEIEIFRKEMEESQKQLSASLGVVKTRHREEFRAEVSVKLQTLLEQFGIPLTPSLSDELFCS